MNREQACLGPPGLAGTAQQRPHARDVQMKPFQEQHREEQPRLVAAQPGTQPVAGLELAGSERDRAATDVRITADLVGMGMMAVVLGNPPTVAEPNQKIAVNPADQAVRTLGAGNLAMPGVMPDEAGLGEHHSQEDRDQHLPPRLPEHGERSPADGQQHQVQADLQAVVDRPSPGQPGPFAVRNSCAKSRPGPVAGNAVGTPARRAAPIAESAVNLASWDAQSSGASARISLFTAGSAARGNEPAAGPRPEALTCRRTAN